MYYSIEFSFCTVYYITAVNSFDTDKIFFCPSIILYSEKSAPQKYQSVSSLNFKLTVKPQIEPFSFNVQSSTSAKAVCVINAGDLPLQMIWSKNGRPLFASNNNKPSNYKIQQFDEFMSVLSISSLTVSDSGNYTCTANNSAGEASYTQTFHVKGQSRVYSIRYEKFIILREETLMREKFLFFYFIRALSVLSRCLIFISLTAYIKIQKKKKNKKFCYQNYAMIDHGESKSRSIICCSNLLFLKRLDTLGKNFIYQNRHLHISVLRLYLFTFTSCTTATSKKIGAFYKCRFIDGF